MYVPSRTQRINKSSSVAPSRVVSVAGWVVRINGWTRAAGKLTCVGGQFNAANGPVGHCPRVSSECRAFHSDPPIRGYGGRSDDILPTSANSPPAPAAPTYTI